MNKSLGQNAMKTNETTSVDANKKMEWFSNPIIDLNQSADIIIFPFNFALLYFIFLHLRFWLTLTVTLTLTTFRHLALSASATK